MRDHRRRHRMLARLLLTGACSTSLVTLHAQAPTPTPCAADGSPCRAAALPRSTPERQGVASRGILDFVEAVDTAIDAMHSVMIVRHGHVVAEGWWVPYDARTPHVLYSLSKSFTSTAVGLAVADGKLTLDDPVLTFFREDAPAEPSATLRQMRVRDLPGGVFKVLHGFLEGLAPASVVVRHLNECLESEHGRHMVEQPARKHCGSEITLFPKCRVHLLA